MASDNEEYFGPELPPSMPSRVEIGPKLPNKFIVRDEKDESDEEMQDFVKQITSQIIPDQQDDETDAYGPMPSADSDEIRKESVIREIERRATKTKELLTGGKQKEVLKREAWMTELPPQLSGAVGLHDRRFKTNSSCNNEDRSVWTETPADREKKMKSGGDDKAKNDNISASEELIQAKNAQQRQLVTEYEKRNKRNKSLFEVHSEKLKKRKRSPSSSSSTSSSSSSSDRRSKKHKKKEKKKKKDKKVEKEPSRRPFDRNTDLQSVSILSSSQRQALMKRSKELNSKFMHGKSHYL